MSTETPDEYTTVVYRIKPGHHQAWWDKIYPLFLADLPVSVVAVGAFDALERLDALEATNDAQ